MGETPCGCSIALSASQMGLPNTPRGSFRIETARICHSLPSRTLFTSEYKEKQCTIIFGRPSFLSFTLAKQFWRFSGSYIHNGWHVLKIILNIKVVLWQISSLYFVTFLGILSYFWVLCANTCLYVFSHFCAGADINSLQILFLELALNRHHLH